MNASTATMHDLAQLAHRCLEHLNAELFALRQLEAALQKVRAALVSGDELRLRSEIPQQERYVAEFHALQAGRIRLQQQIGGVLNVSPQAATVFGLLPWIDEPLKSQIAQRRCELGELALVVDRLTHANATLVAHWSQLLEQIMAGITGQEPTVPRYGVDRRLQSPTGCRSIMEARC